MRLILALIFVTTDQSESESPSKSLQSQSKSQSKSQSPSHSINSTTNNKEEYGLEVEMTESLFGAVQEKDEDELQGLQSDLKTHFGRVIITDKDIKKLRKERLSRRNVITLIKNNDARLKLHLGVIMDIADYIESTDGKADGNDSSKGSKDKGLIVFDASQANFEDYLKYVYDPKYKDVYVVHPKKQEPKGGRFERIAAKIFYEKSHHVWLEFIFTLKLWKEEQSISKSKIYAMNLYPKILKGGSTFSKRVWHWRHIFADPAGYVEIITSKEVKNKSNWFDTTTPLSKKRMYELYLEYENDLKSYKFPWDKIFVEDFQVMMGDLWDSIKVMDLEKLTEEAQAVLKPKKKRELKDNSD